jgi:ABC-type transport system involved in multi-copper enzyme maturation permease subunit
MKWWRMIRFEMAKVWRMRLARALFGILFVETFAKAIMFYFKADEMVGMVATGANMSSANYLASVMLTSLNAVNWVSLVFASLLIAGEASSGSLRLTASLPFSRVSIVFAKLAVLAAFVAVSVAMVAVINLGMAWRFHGLQAVEEIDYVVYTKAQVVGYYFLLHALAILPILALASFGLLISAWSSTSGAAVGVTVLIFLGLSIYEKLQAPWLYLLNMRYSLLEAFVKMAQGYSMDLMAQARTSLCYAVGYLILFAGLTLASFALRDNYS